MAIFAVLGIGLGLAGAPVDGAALATAETAAEPPVPTVVVKGSRLKRRIDRERYGLDGANAMPGGTVADALRRVPSVAVDARGRIYLRGRTNVQVYIDGQPSSLMRSDTRGLVLQSMPSNWLSAIELITVPNAGLPSGGGDAIINLVTNRDHKPGGFASGEVTSNGAGHNGVSVTGTYGDQRLTANLGLNLRQDAQFSLNDNQIETRDGAGKALSLSQSLSRDHSQMRNGSMVGGLTLTPNARNSLSAQLELTPGEGASRGQVQSLVGDGGTSPVRQFAQLSRQSTDTLGQALTLNWTYTDLDQGETLKLNFNTSRNRTKARAQDVFDYSLPIARQTRAQRLSGNSTAMTSASLDYERPLGEGQVTTGLSHSQTRLAAHTLATGEGEIDNHLLSNTSRDQQTISALYGTYQRPFGDQWMLQTGLRAEAVRLRSRQDAKTLSDHYTNWTPSLYLLYQTRSNAKWRLAYSRQQQAASLEARNPSLVYQDAQTLIQGNPDLKDQVTQNFELTYDAFSPRGAVQLRAFYAPTRDVVVPVTRLLNNGVTVREQQNGGSGYSLGLEANTGRQLSQNLNLQLNLGVVRNNRQTMNGEGETATGLNGQAVLNYSPGPADSLAFIYTVQGSGLTDQGRSRPFYFSSLNYSHSFSPKLTLTFDVQNLFGKPNTRQITETPDLITRSQTRSEGRVVMLTLRRSFVHFER